MAKPSASISFEDLSALKDNYTQLKKQGHPDADAARAVYKKAQNTYNTAQRRAKEKGITPSNKAADAEWQSKAETIAKAVAETQPEPKPQSIEARVARGEITAKRTHIRGVTVGSDKLRGSSLSPMQGPELTPELLAAHKVSQRVKRDARLDAIKSTWATQVSEAAPAMRPNRANVGQQMEAYVPARPGQEITAWRKQKAADLDSTIRSNKTKTKPTASAVDRFGFTEQQHDAAFEEAHHRWWSTGGRSVYDPVTKKMSGKSSDIARLSSQYHKSGAFTHPAQFLKEQNQKLVKIAAKGGK